MASVSAIDGIYFEFSLFSHSMSCGQVGGLKPKSACGRVLGPQNQRLQSINRNDTVYLHAKLVVGATGLLASKKAPPGSNSVGREN